MIDINKKGDKIGEKFFTLNTHVNNTHVKRISVKMQRFAANVSIHLRMAEDHE